MKCQLCCHYALCIYAFTERLRLQHTYALYIYVWIFENGAKELKSRPKRAFFSRQILFPKVTI